MTLARRLRRVVALGRRVPPAPRTACHAPSTAMYLDQRGDVRACCWNSLHPMGNVTESSLADIWFGEPASRLRDALAVDDYSLGCHACEQEVARGNDAVVFARSFDHLPMPRRLGHPSEISFAMSNTCNLQCVMCRGEWSSSIRAHREHLPALPAVYGDDFFDELREFLPHLRQAKFLGGEPFLERETFRVWDLMREMGLRIPCSVTTNGTQWNHRVQEVVEDLPVSITVSLDGVSRQTYESIRVGADHSVVMANIERFHEIATRTDQTSFSLTFCLMSVNWFEFADYLLLADRLDCFAGVNTVPEPPEFDIEKLPLDELKVAVAEMEQQERLLLGDLRPRHRAVWDAHLGRLRSLSRAREEGTVVWITPPSDGPDLGPPTEAPAAEQVDAVELARQLAAAVAHEEGVFALAIGPEQVIVDCDPRVLGRTTEGWRNTGWDATLRSSLGIDLDAFDEVTLPEADGRVRVLGGSASPDGLPPFPVRLYVAVDRSAVPAIERVFLVPLRGAVAGAQNRV